MFNLPPRVREALVPDEYSFESKTFHRECDFLEPMLCRYSLSSSTGSKCPEQTGDSKSLPSNFDKFFYFSRIFYQLVKWLFDQNGIHFQHSHNSNKEAVYGLK